MRSMRGKALLSLNDHPKMREVFAGFPVHSLSIRHIVSGGAGVPRREMLVQSWQAP